MYKDKQRESNRERQARYKAKQKALLKGVTNQGVTEGVTVIGSGAQVTPIKLHPAIIRTINRMSTRQDGTLDEQEQSRRMAIATNYERLYPGRPYTGTGL